MPDVVAGSKAPAHAIVARARATLDAVMDSAVLMRKILLGPYGKKAEDQLLGPPMERGFQDQPTDLESLRERLTDIGGPADEFTSVILSLQAFDHLVVDYASGRLSAMTVGAWRGDVERLYGALSESLDHADVALEAWSIEAAASAGLIGRQIGDRWFLFVDDFLQLPGTRSERAARDLIASGRYGTPLKIAGHSCVELEDMLATLRRQA